MKLSTANQQILSLAALHMGFSVMSKAFGFYYVKVFLNFYHIEEKWFQISQILFLIWNAINDPLFAYFQDTTNLWFTRTRRESILYAAPFFALSFIVPWFGWRGEDTASWVVGMHLIVSLCFWDTMFTFIGLAACCLFTEMSQDQDMRIKLTRFGQLGSLLGSTSIWVIEYSSHSLQDFHMFQITCCVIAVIAWLLMRYTGLTAHTEYDLKKLSSEKMLTGNEEINHNKKPQSYFRMTWQILKERDFLSFVITNFFQEFHLTFLGNFTVIICDQLVREADVAIGIRSTFYGIVSVSSQLLVITAAPLVARCGYFNVIRTNFLWKIAGGLTLFMLGLRSPWLLMLFMWIDSCLGHATFALFNLPLADIADEDMAKYNRKHPISSMVFGTNALIVKPAISLSPMFVVAILNRYGYGELKKENGLSKDELSSLHNVMFTMVCLYPLVIGTIQFVVWSMYTIRTVKSTSKQIIIPAPETQ
ncbi:hypothetical protein ScPMuIL_004518 [Solemya velum]